MSDQVRHFPTLACAAIGVGAALGSWLRRCFTWRFSVPAPMPLGMLSMSALGIGPVHSLHR